jgi:hypothetical protein
MIQMIPSATAILTNYRRPLNLPLVIESIRRQTVPVEIFLWDNSGALPVPVDLTVKASVNLHCSARWTLAQFASSDYVFNIDDDLALADPMVIEKCIGYVGKSDTAIGKEGVTADPGAGYWGSPHVSTGPAWTSSVDILKGRFIFARKSCILSAMVPASVTLADPRFEDDIALSSGIPHKVIPSFLHGAFRELPQGDEASWRQPEHRQSREDAFQRWFNP